MTVLTIYDILGRKIQTLVNETLHPEHTKSHLTEANYRREFIFINLNPELLRNKTYDAY